MQKILLEDEYINSYIEEYISIYLDINILVLDLVKKTKYFIKEFNKYKLTIILFKFDEIYEPLLNESDINYFSDSNYILDIYKNYLNSDNDLKVILNINNNKPVENIKKLKSIKNYNLVDLQDLCNQNNISIYEIINNKQKAKKKNELYEELKNYYDKN